MTSPVEMGRQLEQRVADFFRAHGYVARCNEILEGRSGGRHEIDVLAEKSDALTTFRVAVECKAWRQPIEKSVVSKLHYVMSDLGLNKGIIVSLAGCRIGAQRTAADLGVELWGPDELRRHLGDSAVGELSVPKSVAANTTLSWGYSFAVSPEWAEKTIRSSGKGRLGLRTLEPLVSFAPIWLPAYCVSLTVAQSEVKRGKAKLRSSTRYNLYDALDGTFVGPVSVRWERLQIEQRTALPASLRDVKLHASLRKAVQDYARVSSLSVMQRHGANLARHGLPVPCSSLSIDQTSPVYLPLFVGVLEADGRQRAVAVDGRSGDVIEAVSRLLTANVARLRLLRGAEQSASS